MRAGTFLGACWVALSVLVAAGCSDDESGPRCGDGRTEGSEACDDGCLNGSRGACKEDCSGYPAQVSVDGDAIPFNVSPEARLEGARISILEHPEMRVTTGADGHFHFEGLEEGEEVTLTMELPHLRPAYNYHLIQTGTIRLGPGGVERVTFQAVTYPAYYLLAAIIGLEPDEEESCQMVTTVTRVGKSLYDEGAHGEAGATVQIDPPLPPEHGPIYFGADVIPNRDLTETSEDGGVLFVQVPPGEYVWTAEKPGATFTPVKMKCRTGWLVNASPPWGLQALE
ncbi:MAG: hypothetical protein AB1640_12845 [bacterium]